MGPTQQALFNSWASVLVISIYRNLYPVLDFHDPAHACVSDPPTHTYSADLARPSTDHSPCVLQECVTDTPTGAPTLSDLGVPLTTMEERILWELRPFRAGAYYEEQLDEFENPAPPRVAV